MKCPNLVSQSTTTRITNFPLDFGNPSTESMLTEDQALLGMGNGCNKSGFAVISYLHVRHSLTQALIYLDVPFQYKSETILFLDATTLE